MNFDQWIGLVGLVIIAIGLVYAGATYRISRKQASSDLEIRDPGEQAIEVGNGEIYPLRSGNITLVSKDSVTCGHVIRIVNDGGLASNLGEIRALIQYGIAQTDIELITAEGAAMYDSSRMTLPAPLDRAAIYVLPDEPWPTDPLLSFWDDALDIPFSVEANSAMDIKIGLTFFFADGHPSSLDTADFNMYDPIEWSWGAISHLLPFSVSYEVFQENGSLIESPTFSCFDGSYVKGRH